MKRISRIVLVLLTVLLIGLFSIKENSLCTLPILMYHHFDKESTSYTVVSTGRFRAQMTALKEAGYETVTLQQLYSFVHEDALLPEKPVLVTMDDGYTSNLEIAGPILEELGMCATVFVIGINEGEPVYVHSGEPFWQARFSYEEAIPWVDKGVIDVQSHTYDMHQLESYGFSGREGMLQLSGEDQAAYQEAVLDDFLKFRERRDGTIENELIGLAYPFGYYTEELDRFVADQIPITITIDEHANVLEKGNAQTLRMLGRFNVTDEMTGQQLVDKLNAVLEQ